MTSENGVMYMPVAPAYSAGNAGGGFGLDGFGGGWTLLLLLIVLGGWGGFGFGGGMGGMMWPMMMGGMSGGFGLDYLYPWLNNSQHISDGFRDQNLQTSINGLQNGITAGFGNVQLGQSGINQNICQTGNAITGAIRDGFYGAEIAANGRQAAATQQMFGVQSALAENRYTLAQEGCATRTADAQNTTAILNAVNAGVQSIKDQLCNDKIDEKNDRIHDLQQQLYMKDLAASQVAQNAFIAQGFSNEVDQLYNRLNNCPVPTTPVYGRTPIFTCNGNQGYGCACGA